MNNNVKVLVVDDNAANLELFIEFLAVGGYQCLQASSGEAALQIVRSDHPDLVLLDIQLPGIDGLTVAKNLRNDETTKHIKVVALTAHSMLRDCDEVFDGYIVKPVSLKEFLAALHKYGI